MLGVLLGGAGVFDDLKYHINRSIACWLFRAFPSSEFSSCCLMEVWSQLSLYWWGWTQPSAVTEITLLFITDWHAITGINNMRHWCHVYPVWWGYHFGRWGLMVSLKGINLFLQWCPKDLSTYAEISNVCTPELWAEWVRGKADFSFCNTVRQHIMTQGHLGYVCICSLLTVIENKLLQPRTRDMGDNKPGGIVAAASMFISKCICAFSTEFSPWVKGL